MNWQELLLAAGLAGASINAGTFFAFSNFVMPALAKLPEPDGASAMQKINRAAPSKLFLATLFGAGLVCVPVLFFRTDALVVTAVALSNLSLAITALANVPLNNRLDQHASQWRGYIPIWTRWNTARAIASLASTVAFGLAL